MRLNLDQAPAWCTAYVNMPDGTMKSVQVLVAPLLETEFLSLVDEHMRPPKEVASDLMALAALLPHAAGVASDPKLLDRFSGWHGVHDHDDQPIDFRRDVLAAAMQIRCVAVAFIEALLMASGFFSLSHVSLRAAELLQATLEQPAPLEESHGNTH